MFHSVRARLTLLYCGLLAVILVAFSAISYVLLARQIRSTTDASLAETTGEFTAAFRDEGPPSSSREVLLDFRYSDREILVLSSNGAVVASSRTQTLPASARNQLRSLVAAHRTGFLTIPGGEDNDGFRALATPIQVLGKPYTVVVSQPLHQQTDRLEDAARATFWGIPLALVIASASGYLLARKSLAPVLEMSHKARDISAQTLSDRISVRNERDELGVLGMTLNGLLSRLEKSFESQQRFMADASHELRTPLSIMQGEAEVSLSRPHRSEQEYRASLEIIRKASRKLSRIVQNLFLLARGDAGPYPIRSSRFYLDELVADCVTSVRMLAAARNLEVIYEMPPEMLMVGDEDLLHRMVLNLLDNAIKYTPSGGRIEIQLCHDGDSFRLSVGNSGTPIPVEEQQRIFDRFHRLDRTRRRTGDEDYGGGAGLGLPIARWIAEVHGGTLSVSSDESGNRFTATLPAT
jgi:two-component system OmpR family sensor kinase